MKKLGLNEIRERFLKFFENKEHLRMDSFPLIPQNDNSLLLINSGMAPLKPYFTGMEIPPSKRVTTCQKCIRTGDIENVGKTTRHGTFFEMLGNFSFGDYFKEEIIPWAWEFVTKEMEIPVDRLYVSVYEEDDESYKIWNKKIGIPADRIFRMGKDDNFWEVGTGPCGPCSEIYYDKGEKYGCGKEGCTVGCDCDRYIEFWNLVFTQFNKNEDGSYSKLDQTNIDTGMGLERIAGMMQDVDSIFDVDTVRAIRDKVCKISKKEYNKNPKDDVSIRIITDHVRSLTFMTADGVLPSNEGRGYVFRRLLRRAALNGHFLGIEKSFLTELCQVVIDVSKEAYPELSEKQEYIMKVITVEEKRFHETIVNAREILKQYIQQLKAQVKTVLWGSEAFRLYDTYGLPLDLMKEILGEEGITVDEESFHEEMNKQKEMARTAREESTYMGAESTVYHELDPNLQSTYAGYDSTQVTDTKIIAIVCDEKLTNTIEKGSQGSIILEKTPFYVEKGGQKGDEGIIRTKSGTFTVENCIQVAGNKFAHIGSVTEGNISKDELASAFIDSKQRLSVCRNHTATHLLQKALRETVGSHVEQAGSYVDANRLRFDFTHFAPLSRAELEMIEDIVNERILECLDVNTLETGIEEARKMGAMALFGEKYGKTVRVVNVSDYSIELCGGTHVSNTSQISSFNIISESGIAAGVRRIEAVTGRGALEYYKSMENNINLVSDVIKAMPSDVVQKVQYYVTHARELNQEVERLKNRIAGNIINEILDQSITINDVKVIYARVDELDMNGLRGMGDRVKDRIKVGVVVLAGEFDGKVNFVVMATDDVVKKGVHAGKIIKDAIAVVEGNGGGRPNMAQAGGKRGDKIEEAFKVALQVIEKQLESK